MINTTWIKESVVNNYQVELQHCSCLKEYRVCVSLLGETFTETEFFTNKKDALQAFTRIKREMKQRSEGT